MSISGAGSLGVGPSRAGGTGAGVADTGFGLNPLAVIDLMKQNVIIPQVEKNGTSIMQ
jgi:hypothetical protein